MKMEELLRRFLPIFLLMAIGFSVKRTGLFPDKFIEGLKSLIINIALPAVLFDAFSTMELQVSYLLLFLLVFAYLSLLYLCGSGLRRLFPHTFGIRHTSGYMTGFEFGMIGVGLYGAIWGMDNLPVIILIAFGHELFIWFFYVPLVSRSADKSFQLKDILGQLIKMPTIIAIILGVAVNLTGIRPALTGNVIGQSVFAVIDFLKPVVSPLILIVIGYTMVFRRTDLGRTAAYILMRIALVLGLGILTLLAVTRLIPGLSTPLFVQAFFAFILLPAPYILPLYIRNRGEADFFTQLLVYSTVVSLVGYGVLIGLSF